MYAYEARRPRDIPPSASNRYRDTGLYDDYAQPARSSRPSRYQDPEPSAAAPPPLSSDRHRRKSFSTPAHDDLRPYRRANVVASDDGRTSRDAYGSVYPERTSRHDAEAKTSAGARQFREQRRGYENEEADKLRRAKSHSPRRAAREETPRKSSPQVSSKSAWGDDPYSSDPYRPSAKPSRAQQYYGEDAYGSSGRGRPRESGLSSGGKDYYGANPATMPRPPAGDYTPYKSSPLSTSGSGSADERLAKPALREPPRAGGRGEKPSYGGSAAYPEYGDQPPRRNYSRAREPPAKPSAYDDYYPPPTRGRARPPAARGYDDDDDDDPYDRAPPRRRQRQSMPPSGPARSRYPPEPGYDEPSYPPRRAASVNHRGGRGGHDDDVYGAGRGARPRANPVGTGMREAGEGTPAQQKKKHERQKQWGKQAGSLFMKHAVPVIRQEAVPLLTKAAQAYMQQKTR